MIAAFYNKAYFPGLTNVVIIGHSAGGQTVQRYLFSLVITFLTLFFTFFHLFSPFFTFFHLFFTFSSPFLPFLTSLSVSKYAVATGIDANYTVRYVAENPGSYAYLDTSRAILPSVGINGTCYAWCNATEIVQTTYSFALVTTAQEQNCTDYNDWKMGLYDGNVYLDLRSNLPFPLLLFYFILFYFIIYFI
jgi:hypothetical protein